MDSDQGKLFIGGISWETDEERLREYFSQYGDVLQAVVMKDKMTGRPRGFGFVVFSDPSVLDTVLQDTHSIDGRTVEAKRALSREEQHTNMRSNSSTTTNRSSIQGGNIRTKKIFVGGLPPTLTEELFRQYFEAYGHVTDVVIMYDQTTQRPRGFGFISFDNEDAVDQVLHKTFHDLNGKQVEVKRALPKDANPSGGPRLMGAGSGGYPGFGSTGGVSASHDRMDSNRYMQTQNASGFPPYGSSGYSAPGYGYGSNNGVNYGFNYGSAGGYGGGFNIPPRNGQGPSFGSMGYGNATSWGGQGAGTGGNRYGNQGYGYPYGQNDTYGNPGGYGGSGTSNSGGEMGGGYAGGGYGESMGSGGYGNAHWRSEPPSGNYGNGPHVSYGLYGGPQQRQSQQQ